VRAASRREDRQASALAYTSLAKGVLVEDSIGWTGRTGRLLNESPEGSLSKVSSDAYQVPVKLKFEVWAGFKLDLSHSF
jgi:hypothetical protein